MNRVALIFASFLLAFSFPALALAQAAEAVVAIRQYQEAGPSNIHLYLYTLDGKLVRQLTNTPGLDDVSPMLDRAGKSVLFSRQATTRDLKAKEGDYVLDLRTNKIEGLSPAEAKIQEKRYEPTLQPIEFSWPSDKTYLPDAAEGKDATSCQSPDGNYKLICQPNAAYSGTNWNSGPQFLYFLRSKGSSQTVALDTLGGEPLLPTSAVYLELKGNPFVLTPGSKALFMTRHIDSTDGSGLWVFDLKAKRWTEMSENAGLLYFVPGRTGVTLLHSSRYEDLGKSGLVVTCGYLEFWSATFHPTRLGPPTSLFHGAAIYYGSGKTLILRDPEYGS
jgi:hypothetical protein